MLNLERSGDKAAQAARIAAYLKSPSDLGASKSIPKKSTASKKKSVSKKKVTLSKKKSSGAVPKKRVAPKKKAIAASMEEPLSAVNVVDE